MTQHRTRRITIVSIAGVGFLVLGMMPAAAGTGSRAPAATAAASVAQTGQPGLAHRVTRLPNATPGRTSPASPASAAAAYPHGARRLPRSNAAAALATPGTPQAATATGSAAAAVNHLLASFNGTSSRDSEVTNFNARFEPPDQGLCAGAGFILEPVNSAYRIFR